MIRSRLPILPRRKQQVTRSSSVVRAKALVIDHDPAFLAFAAEALNSFCPGFEVTTACDLESARNWLDAIDPDLILAGWDPGDKAANVLMQRVRKNGETSHARIIFLSSRVVGSSASDCGDPVFPKPGRLTDLLALVRRNQQQRDL